MNAPDIGLKQQIKLSKLLRMNPARIIWFYSKLVQVMYN